VGERPRRPPNKGRGGTGVATTPLFGTFQAENFDGAKKSARGLDATDWTESAEGDGEGGPFRKPSRNTCFNHLAVNNGVGGGVRMVPNEKRPSYTAKGEKPDKKGDR